MRIRIPGWLLIGGSIIAVLLLAVRVESIHSVEHRREELAAARHEIARGPEFETLWKKLATATYESGRDDPALIDLLRRCGITVEVKRLPEPMPSASAVSPNAAPSLDPSAHAPH